MPRDLGRRTAAHHNTARILFFDRQHVYYFAWDLSVRALAIRRARYSQVAIG
jgi:hypothetical protein